MASRRKTQDAPKEARTTIRSPRDGSVVTEGMVRACTDCDAELPKMIHHVLTTDGAHLCLACWHG